MVNRRLVLVFACAFGGTVSFYVLLSVVPLYATSIGAGDVGAGLTTAVLMLATVAAELATPWLIAVFGYRMAFALGLVLLGPPSLALSRMKGFSPVKMTRLGSAGIDVPPSMIAVAQ